jgi:hypothetical protein
MGTHGRMDIGNGGFLDAKRRNLRARAGSKYEGERNNPNGSHHVLCALREGGDTRAAGYERIRQLGAGCSGW